MVKSDDEVIDYLDYDELTPTSRRPRKRRRLEESALHTESEISSNGDFDDHDSSSTAVQNWSRRKSDEQDEAEKPKSKYKIHIPKTKNSELPKDAFFTQPPQRHSSPYRIDQFNWQKPQRSSPPPPERSISTKQHLTSNPHVNTISASLKCPINDEIDGSSGRLIAKSSDPKDEFDFDDSYEAMLADLPSDAFSTPSSTPKGIFMEPIFISSQQEECASQAMQRQRLAAPLTNLRQTTLFGTQAQVTPQTQSTRKHNWPLASRSETPTHHKLDREALTTWIYPTNLGTIREYQYSIVARGLYHNMLVALPTGLGKTFIAATVMLNWFRWTSDAQIVFVAPTKPLVSQQVKACFEIAGIPRAATTMLTGGISPGLRAEEWQTKRVFFMTPQTIINDLKTGICDPKKLVLLVVDEAHRATGGYAYVEVVKFLKRFNSSFRVLALTATPGASIESVQEVIDSLGISRVEIRTEESIDIRQYVHSRKIETVLFDNSDEMVMVMDLFARALQPVLDKLTAMNAYWARDPMTLTPYGCNQARQRWMADAGRQANQGIKGMVNSIFSLLASLSHGIELLKFHGIGPFYHKVLAFRNDIYSNDKKGSKYARQINESEPFQTMMSRVQIWINNPDFVGHPKLEYLQSVVMNHFLDAGDGRGASDPSSTRIMVFSHYRDSAEEISRVLKRNEPMIRPHVFVGQANSKGSEGMDQKRQLEVIKRFQAGVYNTLVATSIGEEGLDIGEVDLIICYDASASPIRMLQRMGRTGRKRAGNIVVTLMKGKEENNFVKAKDSYEKMQQEISAGTRFNFHDEESRRIVPKDIQPVVDKRVVEIPFENTQPELPEPSKRGRPPKRPPKKFHMPDGVHTGFVNASRLDDEASEDVANILSPPKKKRRSNLPSPEPLPSLEELLLTPAQEREFERKYLDIKGDTSQVVELPRNDAFPSFQRVLRPIKHVCHGRSTQGMAKMLGSMRNMPEDINERYNNNLTSYDRNEGQAQADKRARFFRSPLEQAGPSQLSLSTPPMLSKSEGTSTSRNEFDAFENGCTTPSAIPSSDDLDADGNLLDLVNDDNDDAVEIASSKSSPPPLTRLLEPFYQIKEKSCDLDLDSEGDLPEFGTLVKISVPGTAEVLCKTTARKVDKNRQRRRVVADDSDDE
ncbi:3'-5' DNA helicase [Mycoblastus sanguinarius]|nr:3'-5' DNA helicase [Mycoblastus sanguinarius]